MPNALIGSLSLLDDLGEGLPLKNIDWEWMYFDPLTLLWAEKIYVPRQFIGNVPDFAVDVGFDQSNQVLNRSLTQAWRTLVEAGVIAQVPITNEIREAASFAYYAVRNRINQTAQGNLIPIGKSVTADLEPEVPTDLLHIGHEHYCINHLDSVAAHLVAAQNTDSVWLSQDRDNHAVRWLYCGGLDPAIAKPRARKAVINSIHILRLPKCEFIPPVVGCASCGNNGSTCFTTDYGVDNWVIGADSRLHQILELRDSVEVASLRRLLSDVASTVEKSDFDAFAFDEVAARSIRQAGELAEKRINKTLKDVNKYCDIAALYSVPLAIFSKTMGASILGDIGMYSTLASRGVSAAARLILEERHSWLSLRSVDL